MEASNNLDDLADSLSASFNVSNHRNDPHKPHPRFSKYKSKNSQGISQEIRRERLLQVQRERRDNYLAVARALAQGNVEDDKFSEDEDDDLDYMDTYENECSRKDSSLQKPKHCAQKLLDKLELKLSYRKQLMQSEWLVDVPETFASDWLALPVPEGKRNLVIAADGETKSFSRSGAFINKFPSFLPGGSRSLNGQGDITILDTIFSPLTRTYYVIDCMVWNGHPYYGCDTEFRWFWMSSKFEEKPTLSKVTKLNSFTFTPLSYVTCDKSSLQEAFSDNNFKFDPAPLDGILFYHKRVHYLPGVTPLVGWLKAYMLPKILGVNVCDELMEQMPQNTSP